MKELIKKIEAASYVANSQSNSAQEVVPLDFVLKMLQSSPQSGDIVEIKPCPYINGFNVYNAEVSFILQKYDTYSDFILFDNGTPSRCFRFTKNEHVRTPEVRCQKCHGLGSINVCYDTHGKRVLDSCPNCSKYQAEQQGVDYKAAYEKLLDEYHKVVCATSTDLHQTAVDIICALSVFEKVCGIHIKDRDLARKAMEESLKAANITVKE